MLALLPRCAGRSKGKSWLAARVLEIEALSSEKTASAHRIAFDAVLIIGGIFVCRYMNTVSAAK
jgi:hypothetical protein